jgi:hypothetical protein
VASDVGQVFVTNFDAALAKWLDIRGGMCIVEETCSNAVALEHNDGHPRRRTRGAVCRRRAQRPRRTLITRVPDDQR